ncbi:MAG: hypothetical protein C4547_11190 [Phycisphaerales bacterium]|nr:MAG: hypothetical protein C4547_11190 [Phycisphaerales bacterium]
MIRTLVIAGSLVVLLGLAVVAVGAWINAPGVLPPQPIAFNHRLHLERVQGLQCEYCHQFVKTQPYAGLPSKHVCYDCHDPYADDGDPEADARQDKFSVLMSYRDEIEDIPWHRVTGTRHDVFFSHRRHVTVAGLDCRACHPDMPDRTEPPTRGPITISMDACLECHEKSKASVDCVSCHR